MAGTRIRNSTRIVRKSNHLSSNIDNEVVILNIQKGEYNGLNEVGTDIWNEIESPILIEDLVSVLMEKYQVEKQDCTSDVIEFVEELIENGLVDIINGEK
jgi:hypothetical protein